MKPISLVAYIAVFMMVATLAPCFTAISKDIDWPEKFVVAKKTCSSDNRYGILVPSNEDYPDISPDDSNYLADLKNHRILGKIKDVNYFENANHRDLYAIWSSDDGFCVVIDEARFGFAAIYLLKRNDESFTQTEIGDHIQRALEHVISHESHPPDKQSSCEAEAYIRIGDDRKILFRTLATTNPKEFEDMQTYCAFFQGIYDLDSAKWIDSNAQPLDKKMYDALSTGLEDFDGNGNIYENDQEMARGYDEHLNYVYAALKVYLPAQQFEKVKSSQIAWLKQRDAIASLPEKNTFVKARIKALQDFFWQWPIIPHLTPNYR